MSSEIEQELIQAENDRDKARTMSQPELRTCWYRLFAKDEWIAGLFHLFGTEAVSYTVQSSVGIIEDDETRAIVTVSPGNVHFGTDPER